MEPTVSKRASTGRPNQDWSERKDMMQITVTEMTIPSYLVRQKIAKTAICISIDAN
jgi:hypothetical protein